MYSDYPQEFIQSVEPDELLAGVVGNFQGKVLSELVISINHKYPGREIRVEVDGGRGRVRIFLVGSRLYQVMWVGPKEKAFLQNVARFLDSFELISE